MAYSKSKVNKKARLMKNNQDGGQKNYGNPGAAAEQMKYNQSELGQRMSLGELKLTDAKTKEVHRPIDLIERPKQSNVVVSDTATYRGPQIGKNPNHPEVTSMNIESFKDFQAAKAAANRPGGSNSKVEQRGMSKLRQISNGSKIARKGNPYGH